MEETLTQDYFWLNIICAAIFIFWGRIISSAKTSAQYYLRAMVPITTYAIVHGLRFGRAIDWNVYYHVYTEIGRGVSYKQYEMLFSFLCRSLYWLNIPYYMFITIECMFFMTCIFILIKNYQKYISFILPLVLPVIFSNDNLIRWYWGFSFLLLSFNCMVKNKRIWMYIWALCACGTHIGYIFFIPLFIFYKALNKVVIPPVVAVVLLYLTSFFVGIASVSIITYITGLLLHFGVGVFDAKVEYYLLASQDLVNGDWGHVGYMERSIRSLMRMAIVYTPTLLFAYSYIDKIKYGKLLYNLFAVGVIVYPLFCVEILDRYASCLVFFSCIVCGVFFYEALYEIYKYRATRKIIVWCFFLLSLWPSISISWNFGHEPACGNNQMFIWDAKGRKVMF